MNTKNKIKPVKRWASLNVKGQIQFVSTAKSYRIARKELSVKIINSLDSFPDEIEIIRVEIRPVKK